MTTNPTAGIDLNKMIAKLRDQILHDQGVSLNDIDALADLARRAEPSVTAGDERALHGFDREDLEAIADGLETGYEKGIDVGGSPLDGIETNIIESTTAAAARFIRAALASQEGAHAALEEVRNQILEEAATVCACLVKNRRAVYARDCVEAIRALKTPASAERSGDHE